jgi:hypothetical protein
MAVAMTRYINNLRIDDQCIMIMIQSDRHGCGWVEVLRVNWWLFPWYEP